MFYTAIETIVELNNEQSFTRRISKPHRQHQHGLYINAGGGVNRNIIINGAMNVAQRSTSQTGLGGSDPSYQTLDRFRMNIGGTSAWAIYYGTR